jgi:hypothetical protein
VGAAAPGPAERDERPAGPSDRTLLVLAWDEADARAAAVALELSPFEAEMRRRRGGFGLHGIFPAAEAEEEAARLRDAGLRVFLVPEGEARVVPWVAAAGAPVDDGLRLRGSGGVRHVLRHDLALIVKGPIVREYLAQVARKKVRTAGLESGYRFHLHLKATSTPLELDPGEFDFRESGRITGSSLLEMGAWIEALGVSVDDGFRSLTPALGAAEPTADPASGALRAGPAFVRPKGQATVLDNLAQFRFYSAWRAAVERRR